MRLPKDRRSRSPSRAEREASPTSADVDSRSVKNPLAARPGSESGEIFGNSNRPVLSDFKGPREEIERFVTPKPPLPWGARKASAAHGQRRMAPSPSRRPARLASAPPGPKAGENPRKFLFSFLIRTYWNFRGLRDGENILGPSGDRASRPFERPRRRERWNKDQPRRQRTRLGAREIASSGASTSKKGRLGSYGASGVWGGLCRGSESPCLRPAPTSRASSLQSRAENGGGQANFC